MKSRTIEIERVDFFWLSDYFALEENSTYFNKEEGKKEKNVNKNAPEFLSFSNTFFVQELI